MRDEELGELAAFTDLFQAGAAILPGVEVAEVGGATCLAFPPVPLRELNHALGLGLAAAATESGADAVLAWYAQRGVAACVCLAPGAEPAAALPGWLHARGLAPGYAWQKFRREPVPAPPARTDLRVEEMADGEAFGRALVEGYGLPEVLLPWFAALAGRPGWHLFAAFDGPRPVGAGALHVDGGVGWLGMGATAAAARGRGAQGAILAARIERARELRCRSVVTETGVPGPDGPGPSYRNILRAGFQPSYVRANWVPAG